MLAEASQVRSGAAALAVEELTLELAEDAAMERPEEILNGCFRGCGLGIWLATDSGKSIARSARVGVARYDAEIREDGRVDLRAREEVCGILE